METKRVTNEIPVTTLFCCITLIRLGPETMGDCGNGEVSCVNGFLLHCRISFYNLNRNFLLFFPLFCLNREQMRYEELSIKQMVG